MKLLWVYRGLDQGIVYCETFREAWGMIWTVTGFQFVYPVLKSRKFWEQLPEFDGF